MVYSWYNVFIFGFCVHAQQTWVILKFDNKISSTLKCSSYFFNLQLERKTIKNSFTFYGFCNHCYVVLLLLFKKCNFTYVLICLLLACWFSVLLSSVLTFRLLHIFLKADLKFLQNNNFFKNCSYFVKGHSLLWSS